MNNTQENQNKKDRVKKTAEERRQDILDAALSVFVEKGYNGATTAEIARAASVAEGTIFRHFATKKELLIAVLEPKFLDGLIRLDKEHKDDNPLSFFHHFLINRLEILRENENLFKLMFAEAQYHVEVREALLKGILGQGVNIIKPWYEKGVEQGEFRDLPFLPTMRSFMGMIIFYGIFSAFFSGISPEKTIEEAADNILDLFLHGLAQVRDGH